MGSKTRTSDLFLDFAVLMLGATSASGRVTIPLMRALGAKKVIGAARDKATLEFLALDATVVIQSEVKDTDSSKLGNERLVIVL